MSRSAGRAKTGHRRPPLQVSPTQTSQRRPAYIAPTEPTWYDLQPIFQQYANLYPVMDRLVNLASYEDIAANARLLAFAFGLPPHDPNHMPVTRDLSQGKRAAILRWLARPGPDGKPRLGQPPVPPTPPRARRPFAAAARPTSAGERLAATKAAGAPDPRDGAKTYAMSQRGVLRIPDGSGEKA